jgi:adenylate cyclase
MAGWACTACGGENPEGMRFCGHCGTSRAAVEAASPPPPTPAATTADADVAEALRSFVTGRVADRLVESGGKLPEERRLITSLFADVSGFTGLADRLDPEQLLEVIDPIITALSNVVGRYEGYVEKFAGDALLALFGAPVSHEDDAARALHVALEMHRELARICEGFPPENRNLTLHVGVNSGHAIARILGSEARMDYAVLGDSVILAQRLESAAPKGETYVSETTYRLTRDHFEFESVGELTLKGKAEPVPAWRLIGERAESAPRAGGGRLVGREPELAAVTTALAEVAAGRGSVVTILGEAGVGKSRLTEEVRARAREAGLRWFGARCLSYGSGLPYWPLLELLRHSAGIRAEDDPATSGARLTAAFGHLAGATPLFARLLGVPVESGSDGPALEPEAFRRALHDAVASWLRAPGEPATVLAVEDVHWADASTLELLRDLVDRTAGRPFALYLVGRPDARDTVSELAPAGRLVELRPLDEEGVASLLEAMLGEPPPSLAAVVHERTGGNPFFVQELVRSLEDTRALARANGGWRLRRDWTAADVPPTIEGVLAARLDLLPRPAAEALQVASVIGRRVPLGLLQAVASDLDDVPAAVERLTAGGFLDRSAEDGEPLLVFHHALVQDVAYARLLRRRRRDLHLRVADVAEDLYGAGDEAVDLLARHLYLGEAGAKAVDYLERAGTRARGLYANEEAIVHFTRAVEVATGEPALQARVPALRLALAEVYETVGEYGEALQLYDEVRAADGDVRAWRGLAAAHRRRGELAQALRVVDEALAREELAGEDLTALWLESGWALAQSGRYEQAIDVLRAGVQAVGERRDAAVGQLLVELARSEGVEGRLDEALGHALDAQRTFEASGDLRGLARTMRVLGGLYSKAERVDDAVAALRRGLELAERTGMVEEVGGCLINLGRAEYNRGALTEAIACNRRAIEEFERIGHAAGRAIGYGNLAEMLVRAGELDEAVAMAERTIELSREIGHPVTIADATDTLALVHLERGELREAAERAEEAAKLYSELGAAPQAAESLRRAAEAWSRAGEPDRAAAGELRARELTAT